MTRHHADPPAKSQALCHECGRQVELDGDGGLTDHHVLQLGSKLARLGVRDDSMGALCPASASSPIELEVIAGHPVHPVASAFPLMSDDELELLADDIERNGQQHDVRLRGGLVLDGRNRLLAMERRGIEPRFSREYVEDPVAAVIAWNERRRHMASGDMAMVLARLARIETARARARMVAGGRIASSSKAYRAGYHDGSSGRPMQADLYGPDELADYKEGFRVAQELGAERGKTAERLVAQAGGTSVRQVERATRVLEHGTPELTRAVDERRVSVETAAQLADLPPEQQLEVVQSADPAVLRRVAAQVKQERAADRRQRKAAKALEQLKRAERCELPSDIELRLGRVSEVLDELAGAGAVFQLLVADPPWKHDNDGGNGAAAAHMETMTVEEICDDLNQAAALMAPDSIFACWVTTAILPELMAEIEQRLLWARSRTPSTWAWGRHRTTGGWTKVRPGGQPGVGHFWRGDLELLLVFSRGNAVVLDTTLRNAHVSPVEAYGEKPLEWVQHQVLAWCPEGGAVLELYAWRAKVGVACVRTRRRYLGIECDPVHHAEGVQNLAAAAPDPREQELPLERAASSSAEPSPATVPVSRARFDPRPSATDPSPATDAAAATDRAVAAYSGSALTPAQVETVAAVARVDFEDEQQVLTLLVQLGEPTSRTEIADRVDLTPDRVGRALTRLVRTDRAVRTGRGMYAAITGRGTAAESSPPASSADASPAAPAEEPKPPLLQEHNPEDLDLERLQYMGHKLASHGRASKVPEGAIARWRGRRWVCSGGGGSSASLVEVVTREEWAGEVCSYDDTLRRSGGRAGTYEGLLVIAYQGRRLTEWVATGQQARLTWSAADDQVSA